eukprot:gene4979-9952_t
MSKSMIYSLTIYNLMIVTAMGFQSNYQGRIRIESFCMSNSDIAVMINGMPGPMAVETAKACVDRGFRILPVGFTGTKEPVDFTVVGKDKSTTVRLVGGPGIVDDANDILTKLKDENPNMIIVDYTHPSAVLNNLKCYVGNNCDFVMGTTGEDPARIAEEFSKGSNYAVIAPNMAKQIVAIQAALLAMVKRFPKSFSSYTLTVTESHQSSKADTSGTAKAIVNHINELTGHKFGFEEIKMLRQKDQQLAFGVPETHLGGHAFHTYSLVSADGSTSFQLQHNVCGRRIYAEGTADAVEFLDNIRRNKPEKHQYNMIDVLESGSMS